MSSSRRDQPVHAPSVDVVQLMTAIGVVVFVCEIVSTAAVDGLRFGPPLAGVLVAAMLQTAIIVAAIGLVAVGPFRRAAEASERAHARLSSAKDLEIKRLASALSQQSAHKHVLDRHAVVSETDRNGCITYINDAFLHLTGYDREELIGANYRIVSSGLHGPEFWRDMFETMNAGRVWQGEICNKRKDGSLYWVQSTTSAVFDQAGQVIGYVSVRIDITEAKRREEALKAATEELLLARARAEAASEAKTNFLSTMSHEMRTPLNGVLGALDLLGETGLCEKQKELVTIAHESGDALLVHINDVLDFSKMEAGKLDLVYETFDLQRLVTSVLHIVAPQAEHRSNTLVSEVVGTLPDKLDGDRIRVRQVLLNLVSNANKFTKNGRITVRVERKGGTDERPEIEVGVADTGIGIPQARLRDLFQEFSMVDSSYTRKTSGTGLGLAISKRLIEAMGGTIGVESTEGVGSRFWFRLALEGFTGTSQDSEPLLARAEVVVPKLRILLADDNGTNQLVASRMLMASGHEVVTVSNGREALDAASKERFDVILTDISMPEMDGIEATRRIRRLAEPFCSVPIVALTANAISGDRERFLAAGVNEYLTKPLRRADIDACFAGLFAAKTGSQPKASSVRETATMTSAVLPLIDTSELDRLAEETAPEVVVAVIDEFLSEMQIRLVDIMSAMETGDFDGLKKLSHAIAGASASAGARRLREAAKRIELDCMAGEVNHALQLAHDLPSLMHQTEAAFRAHLQTDREAA